MEPAVHEPALRRTGNRPRICARARLDQLRARLHRCPRLRLRGRRRLPPTAARTETLDGSDRRSSARGGGQRRGRVMERAGARDRERRVYSRAAEGTGLRGRADAPGVVAGTNASPRADAAGSLRRA